MTLIKSISGIRGTIGGRQGENLTPLDIVEFTAAYGTWLLENNSIPKVVVGRDGRVSGRQVAQLAVNTLLLQGIDVIDLGLSTTPTVEMNVTRIEAGGGIIFTASHNPENYNALKFLNDKGEFISAETGQHILNIIDEKQYSFCSVESIGKYSQISDGIEYHIKKILELPILDLQLIKSKKYKVVVDCINSTGAISIIPLLQQLNCELIAINDDMASSFAHDPEPLSRNLTQLSDAVVSNKADFGIAVDPDVDRLAFMCEDGTLFGEEYTLVAVADFILSRTGGNTVSNLSSTRALDDITQLHGYQHEASAVGEVNVVDLMKVNNAVIGGEGNGGIIYPELHYGRDAMVGVALFLNLVSERNTTLTKLKSSYPQYIMVKDKIELTKDINIDEVLYVISEAFKNEKVNTLDGVKIDFKEGWVHMRKSNTEPIIRVYAEGNSLEAAQSFVDKILDKLSLSV